MILVPSFLLFGFNKGAQKQKRSKGSTQEPRFTTLVMKPSCTKPYLHPAQQNLLQIKLLVKIPEP